MTLQRWRRAAALLAVMLVAVACSDSSRDRDAIAVTLPSFPSTTYATIPASTSTTPVAPTSTSPTTSAATTSTTVPGTTTTTIAPTTTTILKDPSGIPMPATTDLQNLRLAFTDDFSSYGDIPLGNFPDATGGRWGGYGPELPDTTGFGTYDMGRTISVTNGVLDMWVHTDRGHHYVAAPWPVLPGTDRASLWYGRIEFAFRSEPIKGYKTAWLLWPDSGNGRRDGEIDFPEGNLDGVDHISGYVHRRNGKSGNDQEVRRGGVYANNEWHHAVLVWMPNDVEFWLDGVQLGPTITKRVPETPMHWIFQTETKLDFVHPPPDDSHGHVQLDWVAMWQYDPTVQVP